MKALLGLALVIGSLVAQGSVARAESASVCGTLKEYRPFTPTAPGSITVGAEQYAIATGATQSLSAGTTTVGTNVCLTGTWQPSQTVGRELSAFTLTLAVSQTPGSLPSTSTADDPIGPQASALSLLLAFLVVATGLGALWARRRTSFLHYSER